jgi:hypothetical protein
MQGMHVVWLHAHLASVHDASLAADLQDCCAMVVQACRGILCMPLLVTYLYTSALAVQCGKCRLGAHCQAVPGGTWVPAELWSK